MRRARREDVSGGRADIARRASFLSAAGIWLAAFAASLWLSAPAAAALECPPSYPAIEVASRTNEPEIDNTLPQLAVKRMAEDAQYRGRPLGLYRARIHADVRTLLGVRTEGDQACVRVEKVTIEFELRDRRIWIIRERQPGTCEYDVVLDHERKHQAVDDAVLHDGAERLRTAVAASVEEIPATPVPRAELEAAQRRAAQTVTTAFRRAMREVAADRNRRQAAIDTPREYRRVGAACSKPLDR